MPLSTHDVTLKRVHVNIYRGKVKVKWTFAQALRLCTGHKAHRGRRGIALPFLDQGTGREWGVSVTTQPLFTPGKDTVPIVQEAGWAPGPVWTSAKSLDPRTFQPVANRYTDYATWPTYSGKAIRIHSECVCRLTYLACKVHAPYCIRVVICVLCDYTTFFHIISLNGMIFE